MPELSIEHIERIALEVKRQEIVFSHLADELIDHICCDVEFEMQDGLTFYEAYSKVKQKINPRRLKEIQEETLYAIDTKYRNMKNTMKISGITGTVLLGFASLFKIQHWPGAGVMITLGAVILAFVFLPTALGILWKETRNRNKLFLFISAFFASTFFILGILFKIQHWSGAGSILVLATVLAILFFIPALLFSLLRDQENRNKAPVYIFGSAGLILFVAGLLCKIQHWPLGSLLMISGMSILCVIAFPWYTWITWKDESNINARFLYLVIGMLTIIIPGALINLKLQQSYEEGFYKHQEQQQAMYNYLFRNNNSLVLRLQDSLNYPRIEQLHLKTVGLLTLIGNIQTKMVQESEGEPGKPALSQDQIRPTETGPEIQYLKLSKPFHPAPVRDFIAPECSSREELNTSLNDYMKYISGLIPVEYSQKYTGILNPSVFLPATIDECENISLMSGLHSLELLKNSLLTVESNMFTIILRHK